MNFYSRLKKLNKRAGLTLIELVITITLISIMGFILALLSSTMSTNYQRVKEEAQANKLALNIINTIRSENKLARHVRVGVPVNTALNGLQDIQIDTKPADSTSLLRNHNAIFSEKGKVYKITRDTAGNNNKINKVTIIGDVSELTYVPIDEDNGIYNIGYKNNPNLFGFFENQDFVYLNTNDVHKPIKPSPLNEERFVDHYGSFYVDLSFITKPTQIYGVNQKQLYTVGVRVTIKKKILGEYEIVTFKEGDIEFLNIHYIAEGTTAEIIEHTGINENVPGRVLYIG